MKWMSHSMENGQYTDDIHHELAGYHIYRPLLWGDKATFNN